MQSYQHLQDAAKTEPTIRAIARKAKVANNAVAAYLKSQGNSFKVKLQIN